MAEILVEGFSFGFRLPQFSGPGCLCCDNLVSVHRFPTIVSGKIAKEISEGRVAGPFLFPPFANFRVSPLGLVPKKEPNSFRLIHHLSFPAGFSLNDEIEPELSTVTYTSFDEAIFRIRRLGVSAVMAKADIKSAFRLLPIHPSAFNSLGFHHDGFYYYDKCLPMGCSLSCTYFETFSTFLEWVVTFLTGSSNVLHYLDDFLFFGPADNFECLYLFTEFRLTCRRFGVPLALEKSVWPTTCIEFLGVTIDTVLMECRLPQAKLDRLRFMISFVLSKPKVTVRTLQSLLGLLAFATRIIPMGRVFSKRLYRAIAGCRSPNHFVRINSSLVSDLLVWNDFFSSYNGRSFWQTPFQDNSVVSLFTDAAGSTGYGAFYQGHWSAARWPDCWLSLGYTKNVVLLELFPILVSLDIWGVHLRNSRLLFHSDNKGVAYAINCLSSKSLPVLAVLRCIVLKCLELNLWIKVKYIPGYTNVIADSLSRFQIDRFRALVPEADLLGLPCPERLWSVVCDL